MAEIVGRYTEGEILVKLNDVEAQACAELGELQGLSRAEVITQALRLYHSTVKPVDLPPAGCMGDD